MLPKTSAYVKSCHGETKPMYFLIEDDGLLKKYNTIWDKFSTDANKFDSQPVYNKDVLKIKLKSYGHEVTNFHDKKSFNVDSNHTCLKLLAWILLSKKERTIIFICF